MHRDPDLDADLDTDLDADLDAVLSSQLLTNVAHNYYSLSYLNASLAKCIGHNACIPTTCTKEK